MFEGWKRERQVRRVLQGIARQRVALVAQPGNVWVIERALQRDDDTEAAFATCVMRGWVEPLFEDLPTNDLSPDGSISPVLCSPAPKITSGSQWAVGPQLIAPTLGLWWGF